MNSDCAQSNCLIIAICDCLSDLSHNIVIEKLLLLEIGGNLSKFNERDPNKKKEGVRRVNAFSEKLRRNSGFPQLLLVGRFLFRILKITFHKKLRSLKNLIPQTILTDKRKSGDPEKVRGKRQKLVPLEQYDNKCMKM